MDWFLAYAFMKTRSITHKKIKTNISYDFTKGADNYLETRQQTIWSTMSTQRSIWQLFNPRALLCLERW